MRKDSKFRLALMSIAVVLLLVPASGAAFEVQFSGSNATGILGLDVNGNFYDVTFQFDSAANLYGSPPGTWLFDEFVAIDAIVAVNTALNTESAVTTVGSDTSRNYYIGYDFENSIVWVRKAESLSGDWARVTGILFESKAVTFTYAVFVPLSTPVETFTWGRIKALYGN
jgi:hypothetical protein